MRFLNKGQSAIEFMILLGAVIFFIVGFLIAAQISVGDRTKQNKNRVLSEVAFTLQDEILIAQGAPDGYFRLFRLSPTILTSDYTINISKTGLIGVKTDDGRYALAVSATPIMGFAKPGDNEIRSERGKVCLNVDFDACFACGDGDLDGGFPNYDDEECDGNILRGIGNSENNCWLHSPFLYSGGRLGCYVGCTIDFSNCIPQ